MKRVLLFSSALLLAGCIVVPGQNFRPVFSPAPMEPATQPVLESPPPPPPQPPPPPPPAMVVVEEPMALESSEIVVVYEDVLDRRPSEHEVLEWRERSGQQRMSPDDVRRTLRDSNEFRQVVPDRVVRRAFWEYHHVEPDAELMRLYRRRMIDEGWSIAQVRRDIADRHMEQQADVSRSDGRDERGRRNDDRGRQEGRGGGGGDRRGLSVDAIITRAYDDLLERKPDAAGLDHYRRMLEQGASEADIRARIRESEEYRVAVPDAKTRRAYQNVLGRAPDEGGLQHYRKLIVDKGWTQPDVENDLKKSAEYRNRKR